MTFPMDPNAMAVVDWTAVLFQFGGRQEFVARLAGIAVKAFADLPQKIAQASVEQDLQQLGFLAHSVKGICANFHAPEVLALALETERNAKDRNAELALPCAEKLVLLVRTMIDDIAVWRQAHAGDSQCASPVVGVDNR